MNAKKAYGEIREVLAGLGPLILALAPMNSEQKRNVLETCGTLPPVKAKKRGRKNKA